MAGPYVSNEHLVFSVVEADKADQVHQFLTESRLAQWNSVRVIPSLTMEEGMQQIREQTPIF